MTKLKLLLPLFFLNVGCDTFTGEEVARLPINKTSNKELIVKEATLDLKEGEGVSFWTEMDMEYENDLGMVYTVEIWKDSVKQGGFQLDALKTNPTLFETRTTVGNKTSWSFTGKMDHLEIDSDGKYTFKAVINSSDNPTLNLKKAELVIKK
jgi:hypothetical protein